MSKEPKWGAPNEILMSKKSYDAIRVRAGKPTFDEEVAAHEAEVRADERARWAEWLRGLAVKYKENANLHPMLNELADALEADEEQKL